MPRPSTTHSAAAALLIAALMASACKGKRVEEPVDTRSAVQIQQERAAEPGNDQVLEQVRLASIAQAHGEREVADRALRFAVAKMQDFRADGQFRALVGAEKSKEWKGEPYEKMMAFFYLGVLLYQDGQYGNALAMSKSAILADTGTNAQRYRADFVPAFVLQALAYQALRESTNADRSMEAAVDALYIRAYTEHLSRLLLDVKIQDGDSGPARAARTLLLAGLPAGLADRSRDPSRAIDGALSRATDLRKISMQGRKRDRAPDLAQLSGRELNKSFDHLEPLVRGWKAALEADPGDLQGQIEDQERFLLSLLENPRVVLWIEAGRGPEKVGTGQYGQILQIQARGGGGEPSITLGGRPLDTRYTDSVTYQAQTRGSRRVDGYLKGKAVFKDSSFVVGWALLEAGNVASYAAEDSALGPVLYILGAATWIAGAATNPRADIRQWELLPDTLWLAAADPLPGDHELSVGTRSYTLQVPDPGGPSTMVLIPRLPPGGPSTVGVPCAVCEPPTAIPFGGSP